MFKQGICWSISPDPSFSDSHTNESISSNQFTSNLTGLTGNTIYYVRAYVVNNAGISYGDQLTFTTSPTTSFNIGDSYGGGIIFYVDGSSQHGLICASTDQSDKISGIQWYNNNYVLTNATGSAVGTGKYNTLAIVSAQGSGNNAASICNDLELSGFNDWYLPSLDELNLMYTNLRLNGLGNLSNYYWSSTEFNLENAWYQQFNSGNQIWGDKAAFGEMSIRAIRNF